MRAAIFLLAACSALAASDLRAAEPATLEAKAETVTVQIARLVGGNDYVALPALEFNLTIDAACPEGARAESLTVSVADTRDSLEGENVGGVVQTTLQLPRRQSARLRVGEFCRQDDEPETADSLFVADVFTARLSLLCAADEEQSIVYATVPLDVELECEAGSEPDGNQDASSSESAARF